MNLLNKLYLSKSDISNKEKIDKIDIPIINKDNAIFYELHSPHYSKGYNLAHIYCGIILHKFQYYFFTFKSIGDIVYMYDDPILSYNIYPISSEIIREIFNNGGKYLNLNLRFHSYVNYGISYEYNKYGNTKEIYKYTYKTKGNFLEMPTMEIPISYIATQTIQDYINNHISFYGLNKFIFDKNMYRDSLLENILN